TGNKHAGAKFIVGAVGKHTERKQLLSIMDTFAKWQEDKEDALLFIHTSPDGAVGDSLEYTLKMRYPDHNIVLSNANPVQQTDELINKFYNLMDVLVNRSTAEGFGMPIAEAMLAGTPAISVDCPGPAGLITPETGWLLPADVKPLSGNRITPYIQSRQVTDEKFIAALDAAYYNKKELKTKAANCRTRIIKNYNLKQMQKGFEDALKKAIDNWEGYPEYTVHSWPAPTTPGK
ncbi:MAG: glycosyltransferase, partial [Chloroflexota bacterium]|nr:glycosyltransferase [Chloroflexota bacterium]